MNRILRSITALRTRTVLVLLVAFPRVSTAADTTVSCISPSNDIRCSYRLPAAHIAWGSVGQIVDFRLMEGGAVIHSSGSVVSAPVAPIESTAEDSRTFEARFVVPSSGIEIQEQRGRFVIDLTAHELRFVRDGHIRFSIPESAIVALHFESQIRNGRPAGDGYLTIHAGHDPETNRAATVRLRSPDADAVLAQLAEDTGLSIDRSAPRRSFLGIPIRAEFGDEVEVIGQSQTPFRGRLVAVTSASIEIVDRDSVRHTFEASTVLRVEHYVDKGGKAAKAFARGFLLGLGLAAASYVALAASFGGGGGITGAEVAAIIGGAAIVGAATAGLSSLEKENFGITRVIFVR